MIFFAKGCHGQGKHVKNDFFFQIREKSENFKDGQGNLERSTKVREFENNGCGGLQKIYILC